MFWEIYPSFGKDVTKSSFCDIAQDKDISLLCNPFEILFQVCLTVLVDLPPIFTNAKLCHPTLGYKQSYHPMFVEY